MPRRIPGLPDLGWSDPTRAPSPHPGVRLDYRFTARPAWLLGHLLVIAAAVVMVFLGRWQWHVAHVRNGDVQNYSYAFQWWVFVLFAFGMWARIMRDQARAHAGLDREPAVATPAPASTPAQAYRRYVAPSAPAASDTVLDDYNAYLAGLDER